MGEPTQGSRFTYINAQAIEVMKVLVAGDARKAL
jgi:hypothetical protein